MLAAGLVLTTITHIFEGILVLQPSDRLEHTQHSCHSTLAQSLLRTRIFMYPLICEASQCALQKKHKQQESQEEEHFKQLLADIEQGCQVIISAKLLVEKLLGSGALWASEHRGLWQSLPPPKGIALSCDVAICQNADTLQSAINHIADEVRCGRAKQRMSGPCSSIRSLSNVPPCSIFCALIGF